jgi:hypothetical protein
VFANAIFGALAVLFFSGSLQGQIKDMPLNAQQRQAVMAQAADLGNARVPAEVGGGDSATKVGGGGERAQIAKAYRNAFISAYAGILRISSALAFAGALMAVVFVKKVRVS